MTIVRNFLAAGLLESWLKFSCWVKYIYVFSSLVVSNTLLLANMILTCCVNSISQFLKLFKLHSGKWLCICNLQSYCFVGQYFTVTSCFPIRSGQYQNVLSNLPELVLPFSANLIVLVLSWYIIFRLTLCPWCSINFLV